MDKRICILTQELLPLYIEEMCSEQSTALIWEHLEECPECRQAANRLQTSLPAEEQLRQTEEPKAPFRRIKFYYLRRAAAAVAVALLLLAAAVPTVHSLGGDGYGWGSLFGWYTAQQAMEAMVQKDAAEIDRYVAFQRSDGPQDAEQLLKNLEALEQQGVVLLRAEDHLHATDDRFVFCGADLAVEYQGRRYLLEFVGQYTGGKAAFSYPQEIWELGDGGEQPNRIELNKMPEWMEALRQAIATYNPG